MQNNLSNDYVDLGLPSGTWWAKCNIGATMPDDYGMFFSHKSLFEKGGNAADQYIIKLDRDGRNTGGLPTASREQLSVVLSQFWSELLGIPTELQVRELLEECQWTWICLHDSRTVGYRVTSKRNNNEIILPAAGWYNETILKEIAVDMKYYELGYITRQELANRLFDDEYKHHCGVYSNPSARYLTHRTCQPLAPLGLTGGSQVLQFDSKSHKTATIPANIWMPIRPVICP